VFDDHDLTQAAWQSPSGTDSVEHLELYGMQWMPSLLESIRDAEDDARLEDLVSSVAATLTWRPDTGDRSDVVWSEGVNLRREQNLNCLYAVTGDDRLVPVLDAVATANLDPNRYYGPPQRLPHNHGLMANLALLHTADLLSRTDLRDAAVDRLRVAIDASFTAGGVSIEQSTEYHRENVTMWAAAAADVRSIGGADPVALADHIDAVLARARSAYQHLVAPDGVPVPFGDLQAPRTTVVPQRYTSFVDPYAGVLASRWSWSAPDDFWTLRFGPGRRMHGHFDRTSVVWWTTGRPVVVDPGTATYVASPQRTWSQSAVAHSTAVVRGATYSSRAWVGLRSFSHRVGGDIAVISGPLYGVEQTRRVAVDPVRNRMEVTDTAARPVNQVWQLDARWRLTGLNGTRTVARFADPTGAVLLVTTTGRVASVVKGAPGLSGGWTFSYPPARTTAAARMVVTGGTTTRTTFVVTGSPLRPWTS
ncbi:MAG: heparinase II/III family protein, partial [Candidatus Nanopelagicales bacterium]